MTHSIEVKYDRLIVKRALNCFMFKRLGWLGILAVTIPILISIEILVMGFNTTPTYMYVLFALFSIYGSVVAYIYYLRLNTSEVFFAKTNNPTVNFIFSDISVTAQSDLGCSEIKWEAFDEILKFKYFWLLIYARSGYLTLPISALSQECKELIESKILQANVS